MSEAARTYHVISVIRRAIREGAVGLGDNLAEAKLSEMSGQRSGPVREALQIMAGEGVLLLEKNRGARVRLIDKHQVACALQVFLSFSEFILLRSPGAWGRFAELLGASHKQLKNHREASMSGDFFVHYFGAFEQFYTAENNPYLDMVIGALTPDLMIAWLGHQNYPPPVFNQLVTSLSAMHHACIDQNIEDINRGLSSVLTILGLSEVSTAKLPDDIAPVSSKPLDLADLSAMERTIVYVKKSLEAGRFAPGYRLVESELASLLNIGRTPVRQALRVLAGQNLVKIEPNKGVRVREFALEDYQQIFVILGHICVLGIRGAIKRLPPDKMMPIVTKAYTEVESAAATYNVLHFMDKLVKFHIVLNQYSGNEYLNSSFSALNIGYFNRELSALMTIEHWSKYLNRYKMISEYLCSGDEPAVMSELQAHLDDLLSVFQKRGGDIIF